MVRLDTAFEEVIEDFMADHRYGTITLKFEDGRPVLLTTNETFKPSVQKHSGATTNRSPQSGTNYQGRN